MRCGGSANLRCLAIPRWTHELRLERAATWAARGLRCVRGCIPRQHREQRKAMQRCDVRSRWLPQALCGVRRARQAHREDVHGCVPQGARHRATQQNDSGAIWRR
eukprot:2423573-Pleurochrysis_carterae.AAC.1